MSSYIAVPRDLTKVKSKIMFNLTKRQLICFSLAALVGVPSFFLLKKIGSTSMAAMGMMVIMMPMFFLLCMKRTDSRLKCTLVTSYRPVSSGRRSVFIRRITIMQH